MTDNDLDDAFERLRETPAAVDLRAQVKGAVARRSAAGIAVQVSASIAFAALCGLMLMSVADTTLAHLKTTPLALAPLACLGVVVWLALIEALTFGFKR